MRLACLPLLLFLASAAAAPAPPPAPAAAAPALEIQWFDEPADALGPILSQKPRVVAIGEYHRLRGSSRARSSLRHFIEDILPRLQYWPSDLIVETWVTEGECGEQEKVVTRDVRKATKRPKTTENEIVTLLKKAAQIGIQPHILQIPCADYRALLADGGEVDYDKLLVLLTQLLSRKAIELQKKREDSVRPILVYGGALHNDLNPRPEYKNYTFGPQLLRELKGRYFEVDLYVPEYVEKDADITGQPFWAQYLRERQPKRTALIKRAPNSYVVLFPRGQ